MKGRPLLGMGEPCYVGNISDEAARGEMPAFKDLYELASYATWAIDPAVYQFQEDWVFGPKGVPQRCAFCGRTERTGATFDSVSHVIPECVGNKRVVSTEECDSCNNTFSWCEGELSKMLHVERVFSGALGKEGAASLEAGPDFSIVGKGARKPIQLHIDPSKNPIQDTGPNSFDIPISGVEYKPLAAIQSILRSTWLLLPDDQRRQNKIVHRIATRPLKSRLPWWWPTRRVLPLVYVACFSPGAPKAMGRIRVWVLRDQFDRWAWPSVVVSFSLFNTTVIWRAPVGGQYSRGPLPPIPCLDPTSDPTIDRFKIKSDEKATTNQTYSVTYTTKIPADPTGALPIADPPRHPIFDVMASAPIEVAIGTDLKAIKEWLPARRQLKRITGDLSRAAETLIFSLEHGLRIRILAGTAEGHYNIKLHYEGSSLEPLKALNGLEFLERWAFPIRDAKLFTKDQNGVVGEMPLEQTAASGVDPERIRRIKENLARLHQAATTLGVSIRLPNPASGPLMNQLDTMASGIVRRVPIKIPGVARIEISLSKADYEAFFGGEDINSLTFGIGPYPYAEIPELTEELLGRVSHCIELKNGKADIAAAVIRAEGDTVELAFNVEHRFVVFERFLARNEASTP